MFIKESSTKRGRRKVIYSENSDNHHVGVKERHLHGSKTKFLFPPHKIGMAVMRGTQLYKLIQ